MKDAIFDAVGATDGELMDRYEGVRLNSCRERDVLAREITHRLRQHKSSITMTQYCGVGKPGVQFWLDDGQLMRRPIGKFKHLLARKNYRIYKVTFPAQRGVSA